MNWITIKEWFSLVGDVCLFVIAAYTFRLTVFPKKLRFIGYRPSFSTFEGDSLSITLENRSLAPVVVQSVYLLFGEYYIQIFNSDNDGECIIEGFKTSTIVMNPFSKITINGSEVNFHKVKDLILRIATPRGVQYVAFAYGPRKNLTLLIHKIKDAKMKNSPLKMGMVKRNYFNKKIVKDYVRYALVYKEKGGEQHTVFIHQSGFMSEAPFGYNGLPKDLVEDKTRLQAHFENEFVKRDIAFGLVDLWDNALLRDIDEYDCGSSNI